MLVLVLGVLCMLALTLPVSASAGQYEVDLCTSKVHPSQEEEFLRYGFEGIGMDTKECGSATFGTQQGILLSTAGTGFMHGEINWTVESAPETKISALIMRREVFDPTPGSHNNLTWSLLQEGSEVPLEQYKDDGSSPPPPGNVTYPTDTTLVTSRLGCESGNCGGSSLFVESTEIKVRLTDISAPTITISPPSPTTPVHGTVQIPYTALDRGSGITTALLLHDFVRGVSGIFIDDEDRDSNENKCVQPYLLMVPCKPAVSSSFSLDTTNLSDGPHTLTAVDADAGGAEGESDHLTILVHNRPTNTKRPALGGTPRTGQTLIVDNGLWEGSVRPFVYQWLRCPDTVKDNEAAPCTPIPGARQAQYTVSGADAGKKVVARVTAANSFGSEDALSAPSAVVPDQLTNKAPPVISGTAQLGSQLKLDPGRWEDLVGSKLSFEAQWLRCPASVADSSQADQCRPIGDATDGTYTLVEADLGRRLIAEVTASTSDSGLEGSAVSAPTATVLDPRTPRQVSAAPQTTIAKHPRRKSAARKAMFGFSSDEPSGYFECKLDNGRFKTCRSPYKQKVKPGRHTFTVRAVSSVGLADPTPATFRWKVS
jgi:hypothetical protein